MPAHPYFKNLDGLRFIAAFFVILHHTDEGLVILRHATEHSFHFPLVFGPLAVRFFFVLSGFLITYLLFAEQQRTQTINVKAFYMRRILRIWPLYYLIVILALFILPHIGFFNIPPYLETLQHSYLLKILLLVFFIPNVLYSMYPQYSLPHADQLWSIGVEEQFYLIWPLLIKKTKNYPAVFLTIIIAFGILTNNLVLGVLDVLVNMRLINIGSAFWQTGLAINNFFSGWANFQIDSMAVGALGAYLVFFKQSAVLNLLYNKLITRSVFVIFLLTIALLHHYHIYLLFSIIFIIFILNMALNPANKFNVEYPWLKYLGKISYSIYMLHPIAITIAVKMVYALPFQLPAKPLQMLVYPVAVMLSIALATLSYYLLERAFLKMKNKFAI
ncbi:MAG: acyltransferase [Bacteroidota bacterium]